MLPQEIKDRIEKDGVDFFTGPYTKISVYNKSNRIVNAYVAGAEREAENAAKQARLNRGPGRRYPRSPSQLQ
jgi:hypothetical protein